jgi:DNA-binding MarR family transcriptional regulator
MRKPPAHEEDVSLDDVRALAEWRYQIRRFLAFSEEAARSVGIEPQHHQLLLAIKGLPEGRLPIISVLADRLAVRHHTIVELVDRLADRGLIKRTQCPHDRRAVLLSLTPRAEYLLRRLSEKHRRQLRVAGPELINAISDVLTALPPESVPLSPAADPTPGGELEPEHGLT